MSKTLRRTSREAVLDNLVNQTNALEGGMTVAHLVDATGYSEKQVRNTLKQLLNQKLIYVFRPRGFVAYRSGWALVYFKR